MNFFEFSSLCLLFLTGMCCVMLVTLIIMAYCLSKIRDAINTLEAAARYQCAVIEAHEKERG